MERTMASREGMLFKFIEKWKQTRLNKIAKKVLKDNPSLQKDLEKLDKVMDDALEKIKKGKAPY